MTTSLFSAASVALVVIANYYLTTLAVWFGHWSSHKRWSPLRGFHLRGHHRLYPSSSKSRSARYRSGSGRTNSAYALLPWVLLLAALELAALPRDAALACVAETLALVLLINHVHEQFHLERSWLERAPWFVAARRVHEGHHDRACNFMVVDHFWDRAFGTYAAHGARRRAHGLPAAPRSS